MGWFGNFAQGMSDVASDISQGQQQRQQTQMLGQQLEMEKARQQLANLQFQQEQNVFNQRQQWIKDPQGMWTKTTGMPATGADYEDYIAAMPFIAQGYPVPSYIGQRGKMTGEVDRAVAESIKTDPEFNGAAEELKNIQQESQLVEDIRLGIKRDPNTNSVVSWLGGGDATRDQQAKIAMGEQNNDVPEWKATGGFPPGSLNARKYQAIQKQNEALKRVRDEVSNRYYGVSYDQSAAQRGPGGPAKGPAASGGGASPNYSLNKPGGLPPGVPDPFGGGGGGGSAAGSNVSSNTPVAQTLDPSQAPPPMPTVPPVPGQTGQASRAPTPPFTSPAATPATTSKFLTGPNVFWPSTAPAPSAAAPTQQRKISARRTSLYPGAVAAANAPIPPPPGPRPPGPPSAQDMQRIAAAPGAYRPGQLPAPSYNAPGYQSPQAPEIAQNLPPVPNTDPAAQPPVEGMNRPTSAGAAWPNLAPPNIAGAGTDIPQTGAAPQAPSGTAAAPQLPSAPSTAKRPGGYTKGQILPPDASIDYMRQRVPPDRRHLVDTILQAANYYGIDPQVAMRVAFSEGLRNPQGDYDPVAGQTSGGVFQLHVGKSNAKTPALRVKGLGDDFMKRYPGDDPWKDEDKNIWFAMEYASQHGWRPWYGRRTVGVGDWDGIPGHQESD